MGPSFHSPAVYFFLSTKPKHRLRRTPPKWPISCREGRKALTRSSCSSLFLDFFSLHSTNSNNNHNGRSQLTRSLLKSCTRWLGSRVVSVLDSGVKGLGSNRSHHHHHHHHHFILSIIQQYVHLRKYDSRRAGQQGPIKTLTAALKRSIKTVTGCIYYHTNKNNTNEKN